MLNIPYLGPPYPNPPIIEAVIAFHFAEPLAQKTIERFVRGLKKRFPAQEKMMALTIDAAIPSPLINHISFLLDLDVSTIHAPPLRDDELWRVAATLREGKNAFFEAAITDTTRGLFR